MVSEGAESGRKSISSEEEEEVVGEGERREGSSEWEEEGSKGADILEMWDGV